MLQKQIIGRKGQDDSGAYLPTPEEIREQCQSIQQTWDETTRRARTTCPATPVTITEIPHRSR